MMATPEAVGDSFWYYPEEVFDTEWYPDSGATNHITSDHTNLMAKFEFTGLDWVYMGSGKGLSIKHVGHTIFSSPFLSSKTVIKCSKNS